jgi:hypothetical protein|tara:strand:- start:550 stop:720 length:171 start_codon:yes stop_codon:yes gene_type:complete
MDKPLPEPPADRLLKQIFNCVEAREAACDSQFKSLWEVHAETLRRKLRRLLDELEG